MKPAFRVIRPGESGYRRCVTTIMDTTDPEISFDEQGRCHWVTDYFPKVRRSWNPEGDSEELTAVVKEMEEDGAGREYNCILGLSGGLDSSYMALVAYRAGLRPLVVHTDTGWNSELAVSNIEKIVKKCGFNLHTHVIKWAEMASVQRAFLRSGVPNQDIPQDHAIFAAFYRAALKHRVKWVLNGSNFACESILPPAWGYDARDITHLRAIHRRFGDAPIGEFPRMGHLKFAALRTLRGLKVVKLLNLVPYNKQKAIAELEAFFGWRYYGGKHYESRWTRYFQGWWLPHKFGFDKRLAHLSSLILSGQISREEALLELKHDHYPEHVRLVDQEFIIKKLGMREKEFSDLLRAKIHPHSDYPTGVRLREFLLGCRDLSTRFVRS
jgi:aminotransferase